MHASAQLRLLGSSSRGLSVLTFAMGKLSAVSICWTEWADCLRVLRIYPPPPSTH